MLDAKHLIIGIRACINWGKLYTALLGRVVIRTRPFAFVRFSQPLCLHSIKHGDIFASLTLLWHFGHTSYVPCENRIWANFILWVQILIQFLWVNSTTRTDRCKQVIVHAIASALCTVLQLQHKHILYFRHFIKLSLLKWNNVSFFLGLMWAPCYDDFFRTCLGSLGFQEFLSVKETQ